MTPADARYEAKRKAQRAAIVAAKRATSNTLRLIYELARDTLPGRCIFCGEPLPKQEGKSSGRTRIQCGALACVQSYERLWKQAARSSKRAETREGA